MCPSEGSIDGQRPAESSGFPDSWDDALNGRGRDLFDRYRNGDADPALPAERGLVSFENVFTSGSATAMRESLNETFASELQTGDLPLSSGESDGERQLLSRTLRMKACTLHPDADVYEPAEGVGFFQFTESEQLQRFVEGVTGLDLRNPTGHQVLFYERGDYTAPHTDYSQDPSKEEGFVVTHVTLSNPHVERQLLVGESDDHLSDAYEVGIESAITVSRLPSWHYTTPLEGEEGARRWLVNVTYEIDGD